MKGCNCNINLQWFFKLFLPYVRYWGLFAVQDVADADVAIWFFLGAARQYARVCSLPYSPLIGRFFPRFSRNLVVGVLLPVKTGYIHFFLYNLVFFSKIHNAYLSNSPLRICARIFTLARSINYL